MAPRRGRRANRLPSDRRRSRPTGAWYSSRSWKAGSYALQRPSHRGGRLPPPAYRRGRPGPHISVRTAAAEIPSRSGSDFLQWRCPPPAPAHREWRSALPPHRSDSRGPFRRRRMVRANAAPRWLCPLKWAAPSGPTLRHSGLAMSCKKLPSTAPGHRGCPARAGPVLPQPRPCAATHRSNASAPAGYTPCRGLTSGTAPARISPYLARIGPAPGAISRPSNSA